MSSPFLQHELVFNFIDPNPLVLTMPPVLPYRATAQTPAFVPLVMFLYGKLFTNSRTNMYIKWPLFYKQNLHRFTPKIGSTSMISQAAAGWFVRRPKIGLGERKMASERQEGRFPKTDVERPFQIKDRSRADVFHDKSFCKRERQKRRLWIGRYDGRSWS